jgi:hypothetical protein
MQLLLISLLHPSAFFPRFLVSYIYKPLFLFQKKKKLPTVSFAFFAADIGHPPYPTPARPKIKGHKIVCCTKAGPSMSIN